MNYALTSTTLKNGFEYFLNHIKFWSSISIFSERKRMQLFILDISLKEIYGRNIKEFQKKLTIINFEKVFIY